jgi:hypothetical protein
MSADSTSRGAQARVSERARPGEAKRHAAARAHGHDPVRPADAELPRLRLPPALRRRDRVLSWWCARGCPSGGENTYPTAEQASRMAAAMDREPRSPLGFLAVLGGTLHREPRQRDRS